MSAAAAQSVNEIISSVPGLRLWLEGGGVRWSAPTGAMTTAALEQLRVNKQRIVRMLRLEALAVEACTSLLTPEKLIAKLAPEDLAEVELMPRDQAIKFLRAFATAVVWTDMRRQGIAPPGWDKAATCKLCGPVLLWASIDVAGCPWCWNRLHGVKIPRPPG